MSCCGKNNYGCKFNADDEAPSEADIARFGSDDIPCPSCGTAVYHDAPLCQSRGHAMTADDLRSSSTFSSKSLLIGVVALVTTVAFVWVSIG